MRILFFTHRFGRDVIGGAELHLWSLAVQLARRGCCIDVATSLETEIHPFARFGLKWSKRADETEEEIAVEGAEHPIRVLRFPVRDLPKPIAALLQKHLQHRWEREEQALEPSEPFLLAAPHGSSPLLLTGWHLPEQMGERQGRWTMSRATIQLPETRGATLHLRGYAPRCVTLSCSHVGRNRVVFEGKGEFQLAVRLDDTPSPTIAALSVARTWRPLRDTRSLGVFLSQISFSNEGRLSAVPFHVDHRTLRAAQQKKDLIQTYLRRAADRPRHYGWIFDQLRGPRCPGMRKFLENNAGDYDWVLSGIYPFSTLPVAARVRDRIPFRLAALPLFHIDDDFYYWQHYIEALRQADVCLANSWFAGEVFYPTVEARAITVGAGVDEDLFTNPDIDGARFRKRFGFDPDEKIVLSVGRKTGSKLYRTLVRAVDNIQYQVKCRLVLIGPDEDGLPITSPNCSYLGPVSQEDLLDAYEAADVFSLMSESESFGMVFVEAWMRRKAVIGNRNCAPVSFLVKHEKNGLLASNRLELEQHLTSLLTNPDYAKTLGTAGFDQASQVHTWQVIARNILDHFEAALDES